MKIILTKIPVSLIKDLCQPLKAYGVINETAIRDMEIYNEYLERTFSGPAYGHYGADDLAAKFGLSTIQVKRIIAKYKDMYPPRVIKNDSAIVDYGLEDAA
ncbi:MAG TPA: hypothetical protein PKE39_04320 [Ignavibacteria bacterium]|nr:hypothetical protein [Ignavibacteria bacterium]